jgi:hypothetical protein
MPNPHDADVVQLDTWITEDVQIRIVHYLKDPDNLTLPTTTTTTTTTTINPAPNGETLKPRLQQHTKPTAIQALENKQAALSRQHDADRKAMLAQQKQMEASFRERKNNIYREFDRELEALKRARMERELEQERERLHRERERERRNRELALEKKREVEAAALRRAIAEDEAYRAAAAFRRQMEAENRVLREQAAREWEVKMEGERVKARMKELEEAAVARAVEESIVAEVARKVVEREEREKGRKLAEVVAERMRLAAEAKAQEERLRRRVEGKKGSEWASDGTRTGGLGPDGEVYAADVHLWGPRVGEAQDCAEAPYPPTTWSYTTAYSGVNRGTAPPPSNPAWYQYTRALIPKASSRDATAESDTRASRRRDRGSGLDTLDELDVSSRGNAGKEARRWRETTTERWETVVRRGDEGGQDAYSRYKEVFKSSTRRFL